MSLGMLIICYGMYSEHVAGSGDLLLQDGQDLLLQDNTNLLLQ